MPAGVERAHVIALAHFHTVVTQQGVRSGHVEEKLRQAVRQQVILAREAFFLRCARTGHDLDAFLAIDLLGTDTVNESQHLGDQCLQLSEGGLVVVVLRHFNLGQARGHALGEVHGDLHLAYQREHVREQARLQERIRIDVFRGGVGFGLVQDIAQGVEHLLENRDGGGVQGNSHGDLMEW